MKTIEFPISIYEQNDDSENTKYKFDPLRSHGSADHEVSCQCKVCRFNFEDK